MKAPPGEPAWLTAAMERIHPASAGYREDPVGWVHEVARDETWSGQRIILDALKTEKRIAVKAAHSLGKSFIVGRAAMWWLQAYGPERSFVLTTAPSFNQVRSILWKEIGRAHERSGAPYHMNQTEVWAHGELVAMGRKPADYSEDAFQGIHAEHVLVIIDEACGVPQTLWEQADSVASNEGSCILAIGNPTNPSSHFKTVCESKVWHTIRIDGLDSPNFTDEKVSPQLRRVLMSKRWADEKKDDWGEDSPMYISRVRGEFPKDADDGVVPYSWAVECWTPHEEEPPADAVRELGVDVGAGGDFTVVIGRHGKKAMYHDTNRSSDPEEVAEFVIAAARKLNVSAVKVDYAGIGFGITGMVRKALRNEGVRVVGVSVGKKSRWPDKFRNLRSELWWEVGRELSRTCGWDLSELNDEILDQLTKPTYELDNLDKVMVEKKEDLIKRIGRSPDDADALLLAFYSPAKKRRQVRAKST